MCWGSIGIFASPSPTVAVGLVRLMVRLVGEFATAFLMPTTYWDIPAAALFWNFTMVLIVQAASCAVKGLPSLHFDPAGMLRLQLRPSFAILYVLAQSV